jgi:hypothetical protein
MRTISTEKFARNFGHGGSYDQSPNEGRDSEEQGSLFYDMPASEDDIIEQWKPKKKKHKKKNKDKIEKFPEKAL